MFPPKMRVRPEWQPIVLLIAISLALYSHGFGLGFFFDDNNHLERCQRDGFAGLSTGNTFRWSGELLHVWWVEEDMAWTYFRPLAVFLRTLQLQVFGLNATPFHAVHLALYTSVIVLFYHLLRRLELAQGPAFVGAAFFMLHPGHGMVGPWLANDGPVLTGLGFALGFLAMLASQRAGHRRPILWIAIVMSYALALAARESGLMLGPLLLLFDWYLAGRTLKNRPWALYGILTIQGFAYLGIRWLCLEPGLWPREPYMHWPAHAGYLAWLPYKILCDLVTVPWGLPSIPIFTEGWLRERPIATGLAVAAALAAGRLFLWPLRRSWAAWGVLAGTILTALPTLNVFAASYNYYGISAGWACLLALWTRDQWPTRPRLVLGCLAGLGLMYLGGQWSAAWILHAGSYGQETIAAEILNDGAADYPLGTKIFLIDPPLFATEVGPAVRLRAQRPDLQFFGLTFAPQAFALNGETTIVHEDSHTLLLRRSDDGWFAGALGEELYLGWFGARRSNFAPGTYTPKPAAGDLPFRVEIVACNERGIQALRFVFAEPLDAPGVRIFAGSSIRSARPIRPGLVQSAFPTAALDRPNARMGRMQITSNLLFKTMSFVP